MTIQRVRARFEPIELARPYTIAFRTIRAVELGVVEPWDEDGRLGLGSASPEPYVTGETLDHCRAALAQDNLAWLVGRDVRELPALCRELQDRMNNTPAARAAVDMGLHDLLAQRLGVPLVRMLGQAHASLPTSITIGIKPVRETLAEAEEYVGRGFRILKVKLGHSLKQDLERLERLREQVGPLLGIRVDANQGYGLGELRRLFEHTGRLGIEAHGTGHRFGHARRPAWNETPDVTGRERPVWNVTWREVAEGMTEAELIEQPLPPAQNEDLRGLPGPWGARIALDESLLDEEDALRLAAAPPLAGIFNVKLMKCGGIWSAGRIASISELAGIELMWGCNDESIISISAALHTALASPATRYLDLDGSLDLARDLVEGGFVLADGCLRPTEAPGLGLRPIDS